jgi:cobalt-zinc-cadmium efflux system protein
MAHAHPHTHDHSHAHRGHAHGSRAPLGTALVLTIAVAVAELAGGILSGSLALLSDSAHVFMDAVALGIAVAAAVQARRPPSDRRSYGFARFEILAALGNGGLLFGVTLLIAVEALRRFVAPPELPSGTLMAAFGGVGLAVNLGIGLSLFRNAREDLNVKAALFHVASDAVGALAVVLGGALVLATRATWIDPALSLFVSAIIIVGVVRVVKESADVLLESAPAHATLPAVREKIRALTGVVDVHDLHVWTIGSGSHVLSAHVLLPDARISEASEILRGIETRMREDFAIDHVTIQFECESCAADDRIVCTQNARTGIAR